MRASEDFAEVSPNEEFDRGFEFVSRFTFDEDEVIDSVATCLCEVETGTDAGAQSHVGATSVVTSERSGRATVAAVRLSGLLAGVTYRVTMRVLTSRGQVLELYAEQPCRARA